MNLLIRMDPDINWNNVWVDEVNISRDLEILITAGLLTSHKLCKSEEVENTSSGYFIHGALRFPLLRQAVCLESGIEISKLNLETLASDLGQISDLQNTPDGYRLIGSDEELLITSELPVLTLGTLG